MKRVWIFLIAFPLPAHVISMSSGDFRITGNKAVYELRMPIYEVQHVPSPERMLFENIHFSSAGAPAVMRDKKCEEDKQDGSFGWVANYEFPAPGGEWETRNPPRS